MSNKLCKCTECKCDKQEDLSNGEINQLWAATYEDGNNLHTRIPMFAHAVKESLWRKRGKTKDQQEREQQLRTRSTYF